MDDDTGYLTGFQKLVEKTGVAENVVSLFNKLLHNKYPKFTTSKTIHIQDLLSWSIWPDIIIIFGKVFNMCMLLFIVLIIAASIVLRWFLKYT